METIISYRQLNKNDFKDVYNVAFEAWNFTYRDILTPEDIQEYVDKFYSQEAQNSYFTLIEKGQMFFEVAEENENIIGFCNIEIKGDYKAELLRIYLKPSYIGKGVGKQLLVHGKNFLIEKNVKKLYCYIHPENKLGSEFYTKNGFIFMTKKRNELFDDMCDLLFEKELKK